MIAEAQVKTSTRLRPVFCVIGQAYRDRAVAEEVAAGRFTHIGITCELGLEPDWMTWDLPIDEEWRIEWGKFYYGLDLAHAFSETGERRYQSAWESLIRSWIRQVPIAFDTSDVTGRRIQNWIYACDRFRSSPEFAGFAEDLEDQIIASIARQVKRLRHNLTAERNHRTLELYALFIAALALPEIDSDKSLLDFSIKELHRNLLADIRPDGVHRESSTHYHMTALRSFLGARENARRFGLEFSRRYDERLERACEFAMHCHRPDGFIPALSDSDAGSYLDLLELAASIFSRSDFLYVATAGEKGSAPRERLKSFSDGGYFIQRSGWGIDEDRFRAARFLIFDCGPLGDGGHGHYDLLNLEIAAGDRPLVIDPGRHTYSEQGANLRRWFKSTAAHNTVTVDGLDQTPYRRGKPKGPIARGRFIKRLSAPAFDVLSGAATSPAYEVAHTRHVFFIANQYWIIADRLRGDRPHRFDLRFHLSPEAEGQVTISDDGDNSAARAPGCALVFYGASKLSIEPGWYAPLYGVKHRAPVLNASVEAVRSADFFTLIVPLNSDQKTPSLKVRVCETGPDQTIIIEVSRLEPHGLTTDIVALRETGENLALGPFRCRASAACLRVSPEQTVLTACDVRELARVSNSEKPFLKTENPIRWIKWDERSDISFDNGGKS